MKILRNILSGKIYYENFMKILRNFGNILSGKIRKILSKKKDRELIRNYFLFLWRNCIHYINDGVITYLCLEKGT
jgi:hypothetical protein